MGRIDGKRQGGFSLMEMAISMVVMTILAGALVARTPDFSVYDNQRRAAEIRGMLSVARAQAVAGGRTAYVTSSPSAVAACWSLPCPAGGGAASPLKDFRGADLRVDVPAGSSLSGTAALTFAPNGSASADASISVGHGASVTVDSLTGMARTGAGG